MLYLSFGLGAPTPGIARVPFDSNMRRPADSPRGRKRYTQNRVLLLLWFSSLGTEKVHIEQGFVVVGPRRGGREA